MAENLSAIDNGSQEVERNGTKDTIVEALIGKFLLNDSVKVCKSPTFDVGLLLFKSCNTRC